MRRDVLRIGLGRLSLEIALGIVLLGLDDRARLVAIALAIVFAVLGHFAIHVRRRAFLAANLALAAAAIPPHVAPPIAATSLAAGLGLAIELAHVDLLERRRIREHLRTLRVPASLIVRRLGSVVIAAAAARAAVPVLALAARPAALAPVFVVLGAIAMLSGGFAAGPGRPRALPVDAAVFALLSILLAIPPA